jgi:hypothetical protein
VSGAHRLQKSRTRPELLKPLRILWSKLAATWERFTLWGAEALCRLGERFDTRTDAFWAKPDVTDAEGSPEASPVFDDPTPEPEPALALEPPRLTPNDAAAHLHAEHHPLPWQVLDWRINGDVHGQVRSLDCGPDRMREVVELYADALGVTWREDQADEGRTVLTATGVYAGVLFIVSAVFISAGVVPLRVYDEATEDESLTDTLTTQVIPERVLAEVLSK